MNRLLGFLIRNKNMAAVMAGSYFAAVVLLHDQVSRISQKLEQTLTMSVYNRVVASVGMVALAVFLVGFGVRIMKAQDRLFKGASLLVTAIFMVVSSRMLLVLNAECVHFFQYALLSIPIFALTLHFGETVFWVTLLGAVDEAYQYFFLYPKFNYYDFNDVLLNLLGGALGVVAMLILLDEEIYGSSAGTAARRRARIAVVTAITLLAGGVFMLFMTGKLRIYPGDGSSRAIVLFRGVSPFADFWSPSRGKEYHVLRPSEGSALILLLLGLYSLIDRRVGSKRL